MFYSVLLPILILMFVLLMAISSVKTIYMLMCLDNGIAQILWLGKTMAMSNSRSYISLVILSSCFPSPRVITLLPLRMVLWIQGWYLNVVL